MTPSEFANKIRSKYPGQYDDIGDTDLTSKVLAKHPEYSDMVEQSSTTQPKQPDQNLAEKALQFGAERTLNVGNEARDVLRSGYDTLKNIGSDIMHPSQIPSDVAGAVMKGQMPDLASGIGNLGKSLATHPINTIEQHPIQSTLMAQGLMPEEGSPTLSAGGKDIWQKLKGSFKEPVNAEDISTHVENLQNAIVEHRKDVGAELGKLRGTSQSGMDRLSDIAEKGAEPSVDIKTAAFNVKSYLDSLPEKAKSVITPAQEFLSGGSIAPEGVNIKGIGQDELAPIRTSEYEAGSKPIQKGDIVPTTSSNPNMPEIKVMHNGPHTVEGNTSWQLKDSSIPETDPTVLAKRQETAESNLQNFGIPKGDINYPRHGAESDIPTSALKEYGYKVPEKMPFASPQEELAHITKLKGDLYDQLNRTTLNAAGQIVKAVSSNDERAITAGIDALNKRMTQIPGGPTLRAAETKFAQTAQDYKAIQSQMKEPGQAEAFLRKLVNNPTGKNADYLKHLQNIQTAVGKPILDNALNAIKSADQGLSMEQLKHPLAHMTKSALSAIPKLTKEISSYRPRMGGITAGFPLSDENKNALKKVLNNDNSSEGR